MIVFVFGISGFLGWFIVAQHIVEALLFPISIYVLLTFTLSPQFVAVKLINKWIPNKNNHPLYDALSVIIATQPFSVIGIYTLVEIYLRQ